MIKRSLIFNAEIVTDLNFILDHINVSHAYKVKLK